MRCCFVFVSSVLLRQNPHNVHEWQKRVKLFKDDPRKAVMCYAEAVKTIKPKLAVGKLCNLWIEFAK
jgi:pre-mRNA-splicing factor SYF1